MRTPLRKASKVITPAHDANDFALGQRHGLPSINVMDETAHMNASAGPYAGLDRYAARKRILEDLEALHLLGATLDHVNSIGKCGRCRTNVEPRLSTQWFVRIQPLADQAIAAVEAKSHSFTPEQYWKTYFEWMRNIHDWCISRQLWWGHRIPAWHCRHADTLPWPGRRLTSARNAAANELQQETRCARYLVLCRPPALLASSAGPRKRPISRSFIPLTCW